MNNTNMLLKMNEPSAICSELYLFLLIDELSYVIWRIEHDLKEKKINYPEWYIHDKSSIQTELELAIEQTLRFIKSDSTNSTEPQYEYNKWYKWWKNYIKTISEEDWAIIIKSIENGVDCSAYYHPEGSWK